MQHRVQNIDRYNTERKPFEKSGVTIPACTDQQSYVYNTNKFLRLRRFSIVKSGGGLK